MEKILVWLIDNKKWLFSGAGLMVLVWGGRLLFKKKQTNTYQKIRSGHSSTNIQAGRDISNLAEKPEHYVEED